MGSRTWSASKRPRSFSSSAVRAATIFPRRVRRCASRASSPGTGGACTCCAGSRRIRPAWRRRWSSNPLTRTSSSTSRSNPSRATRSICIESVPAEPVRRKQFATISLSPETVWKRLRARMLAWFPHIHSKERDVFENHGKKLTAALFAAGLHGAASSWAQAPGGPEGMGPMRGFERLHKELNLNAQQEDLWKSAQTAQRVAFRSMRARGEETRAKLRVEIDKPGADLKQFAQLRDELGAQMRAQMEAARKQVREAWFAVYDTLDSAQKEKVRVAIRDGMDRTGRHRGGPRGEMHG